MGGGGERKEKNRCGIVMLPIPTYFCFQVPSMSSIIHELGAGLFFEAVGLHISDSAGMET